MNTSTPTNRTDGSEQPSTIRCIFAALRENFALLVAGSLAYSTFVSVFPLLTLAFVVASAVGGEQFVDQVLQYAGQYVSASGQELLARAIRNRSGRAATSVFSLLLLLWSSLRVFRTLDTAFSMFYNTTGSKTVLGQTRDTVLVFVTFSLALFVSVGLGVGATFRSAVPMSWLVLPVVLVAPLVLAFIPIFYVFPDRDVTVREVLPGAIVSAIGWGLLQSGFQLYTSYVSHSPVYGLLSAVLLVLTWLYLAGLLLLVGVAVNVVLAGRTRAALASPPSRTDVALGEK